MEEWYRRATIAKKRDGVGIVDTTDRDTFLGDAPRWVAVASKAGSRQPIRSRANFRNEWPGLGSRRQWSGEASDAIVLLLNTNPYCLPSTTQFEARDGHEKVQGGAHRRRIE